MKVVYLIPPVLALTVSAAWLGRQHVEFTKLDTKTRVLEERIVQYEALPEDVPQSGVESIAGSEKPSDPFTKEDGTLNWLAIGEALKESERSGGMPSNFKMFIKLQKQMMSLELEEIREALESLESDEELADVSDKLEAMLLGLLLQKEPEEGLNLLKDQLGEPRGQVSWQVQQAFGSWLEKDPIAAMAWFDQRRAEGSFDSKALDPGQSLAKDLEARVLMSLARSDPTALKERVDSLSRVEAKAALRNTHAWSGKLENLKTYTDLAREHFDENEKSHMIGSAFASAVHHGGLDEVSKRMGGVELSEEERKQVIDQVRNEYSRPWNRKASDIVDFHAWAQKEAPEQAAELTGRAFAEFGQHDQSDFSKTFQEVVQLSEKQNDPAILQGFGESLQEPEKLGERLQEEGLKGRFEELMNSIEKTSNE